MFRSERLRGGGRSAHTNTGRGQSKESKDATVSQIVSNFRRKAYHILPRQGSPHALLASKANGSPRSQAATNSKRKAKRTRLDCQEPCQQAKLPRGHSRPLPREVHESPCAHPPEPTLEAREMRHGRAPSHSSQKCTCTYKNVRRAHGRVQNITLSFAPQKSPKHYLKRRKQSLS